jgi:hypothetical protein
MVANNIATIVGGANTLLPTRVLILQTMDGNNKRPKYSSLHLEKFIGEDETLYLIFYGLLESKLRTDA